MCKPLELVEKVENSRYVSDNLKEVVMYKRRGFGKILVETLLDNYLIARTGPWEAKTSIPGGQNKQLQCVLRLAQACSPSAQVKAAVSQAQKIERN
jgi:hypothetical protein